MPTSPDEQSLRSLLEREGVGAALAWLNRRVPYRFTGIYGLSGAKMRNTHFYDRLGGYEIGAMREVPLSDSFCYFVFRDGKFVTEDASIDTRLQGNPYRDLVASYVGLPLVDDHGALLGTLRHLDTTPHPADDTEFLFLQRAARLLPPFLRG